MAITEIMETKLINDIIQFEKDVIFFYTATCGTCKLAERMLEIVDSTKKCRPIFKININYAPVLRDSWKISSVPCLVVLKDGEPVQFVYAMRSVDYLYGLLKQ